jgi:actin-like ATPase involved in cell morphogenesis
MGYRLGVDLGTTFTAAAVDDGTGPAMVGLGNRALTVPSVLFLAPDGTMLVGEPADRRAPTDASRTAREFKRRIGDPVPVLLGGQPFSPQSLSAKLLSWVVTLATERQGAPPDDVVVTYPANWGDYKRELLRQLVSLADLPDAVTCTEPEAAATQYASRASLAVGDKVAVYDLGGGTFDVCVLEKHEDGMAIIGTPDGVEHLGGVDFDEAVFHHVLSQLADRLAAHDPDDPDVTTALARLRRDCVDAKEALSSDVQATVPVHLPDVSTSVRITRPEFEELIDAPIQETLGATHRALRSSGVEAADLAAVVLVGGSSRIPLVSHRLQDELGARIALDTHPKHDVALGAVRHAPRASTATAPRVAPVMRGDAVPARRRSSRALVLAGAGLAAVIVVGVAAYALNRDDDPGDGATTLPPAEGRVLAEDFLLVPMREAAEGEAQLQAVSTGGQGMVEFETPEGFDYDAPWISRDGSLAGYRFGPPGSAGDGPWVNQVMNADHEVDKLFATLPPEGVSCNLRVSWDTQGPGVLLNCVVDTDGDGDRESALYRGSVTENGQVDGATLKQVLTKDDPTEDRRAGSPSSTLRAVSFLPDGTITVQYDGGEEPGIHLLDQGPPRRLTSGTHDDYAVASPVRPLIAFVRDGDLYLVSANDNDPPCPDPRQQEEDEETGAVLCNLTGDATSLPSSLAMYPTWSWDGENIALTIGTEHGPSTLSTVSLSDADDPKPLVDEPRLFGAPAWGPR